MSFVADAVDHVSDVVGNFYSSIGDSLGGLKYFTDPVVAGVVDPVGRWTPNSLQTLDDYGLGEVGRAANKYGPAIAAAFFGGYWASGDAAALGEAAGTASSVDSFAYVDLANEGMTAAELSSSAATVSTAASSIAPTWFETAAAAAAPVIDVAKDVNKVVNAIQIVNPQTHQRTLVPANAPLPTGWAIDSRYTPDMQQPQFTYDPSTGALIPVQTAAQTSTSGTAPATPIAALSTFPWPIALLVAGAALYYWKG